VDVFLSQPFTITNVLVYTPSDWTIQYTMNSYWNNNVNAYEGNIDFSGITDPVSGDPDNPGTLDFSYKILFSGATSYTFTQEMSPSPVPEPGTVGLLAMGGLLYGLINRRIRQ
jgi:hypothetical protein